jgi:hypothetical protein
MTSGCVSTGADTFAGSQALFDSTLNWLDGGQAAACDHAQSETRLQKKGRELLRQHPPIPAGRHPGQTATPPLTR